MSSRRAWTSAGDEAEIHSEIEPELSRALTRLVAKEKPVLALEVGMACGIATLSILAALEDGAGLISVDPFQDTYWKGIGSELVRRSGSGERHELIKDFDYFALPHLLREGRRLDFAYIDGMHTFEYVMLDFFYIDKMMKPGGIVGFNDCGWRSIHKFLRYLRRHRKYEELDVGLAPDYRGRNLGTSAMRRLTGRSSSDRYFRKVEDWEPPADFYARF